MVERDRGGCKEGKVMAQCKHYGFGYGLSNSHGQDVTINADGFMIVLTKLDMVMWVILSFWVVIFR